MFLIIERTNEVVKKVKELTEQQLQALIDTEDYIIIKLDIQASNLYPNTINVVAEYIVGEGAAGEMESVEDGTIHQDSSIVEIR